MHIKIKKEIIALLVLTMLLSFMGCVANADGYQSESVLEQNIPEEGIFDEEQLFMNGLLYRTSDGDYAFIVNDYGPIIIMNETEEMKNMTEPTYAKIAVGIMMLSYPGKTNADNVELMPDYEMPEDEKTFIDNQIEEMIKMGYAPEGQEELMDNKENKYDIITKIVDKVYAQSKDNIVLSPVSLNTALAMAANGANPIDQKEFEQFLGMTVSEYNDWYKSFFNSLNESQSIETANSVWIKEGEEINENYDLLIKEFYDNSPESIKFDEDFVRKVNSWCAEKTHNKINSIINEPPVDSVVLLINALYFKSDWLNQYEEYQVEDIDFKNQDGNVSTVDGLCCSEDTLYLENDKATGFMKIYKNGCAFVGILPKEEGDFSLSDLDLQSLMESAEEFEVNSVIPKFKIENSHEQLLTFIKDAGFDVDKIPLTDLVVGEVSNISSIIQKATIDVNEAGSEAAAVTTITIDNCAMFPKEDKIEPKEVILDRAFSYIIYDMENDAILFIGKVVNM